MRHCLILGSDVHHAKCQLDLLRWTLGKVDRPHPSRAEGAWRSEHISQWYIEIPSVDPITVDIVGAQTPQRMVGLQTDLL